MLVTIFLLLPMDFLYLTHRLTHFFTPEVSNIKATEGFNLPFEPILIKVKSSDVFVAIASWKFKD